MEQTQNIDRYLRHNLIDAETIFTINNTPFYLFEGTEFIDKVDFPYSNRSFYKISLVKGAFEFYYGDQHIKTGENTLLFLSPNIPFSQKLTESQSGYCCIFTEDFFSTSGITRDYPQFRPGSVPAFDLSREELGGLTNIFFRMSAELDSDFVYKYDILRTLVLELIYAALKMQPVQQRPANDSNASQRIVHNFMELLEQQFPITSVRERIKIRFAVDFASHLAVHVNHLNRALKEITGDTTTQSIAQRLLKESQRLLKETDWNISEIGWSLGFEELPHFINFFKKRTRITPKVFRQQHVSFNITRNDINETKNE